MAFVRGKGGIPWQILWYCVRNEGYAWTEMGSVKPAICLVFSRGASSFPLPGGGTRTERVCIYFGALDTHQTSKSGHSAPTGDVKKSCIGLLNVQSTANASWKDQIYGL